MIRAVLLGLALSANPAAAAEQGCAGFAWNLDAERALLAAPRTEPEATVPVRRRLVLKPLVEAALPKPPERAPRAPGSLAGATTVTIPEAGLYRVTLDAEAWLDVIQDGAYRRAEAFTGARGCPGIRKSVRFRLEGGRAVVQVSGTSADAIAVAVTREP